LVSSRQLADGGLYLRRTSCGSDKLDKLRTWPAFPRTLGEIYCVMLLLVTNDMKGAVMRRLLAADPSYRTGPYQVPFGTDPYQVPFGADPYQVRGGRPLAGPSSPRKIFKQHI
jgi:hypothetical protein